MSGAPIPSRVIAVPADGLSLLNLDFPPHDASLRDLHHMSCWVRLGSAIATDIARFEWFSPMAKTIGTTWTGLKRMRFVPTSDAALGSSSGGAEGEVKGATDAGDPSVKAFRLRIRAVPGGSRDTMLITVGYRVADGRAFDLHPTTVEMKLNTWFLIGFACIATGPVDDMETKFFVDMNGLRCVIPPFKGRIATPASMHTLCARSTHNYITPWAIGSVPHSSPLVRSPFVDHKLGPDLARKFACLAPPRPATRMLSIWRVEEVSTPPNPAVL